MQRVAVVGASVVDVLMKSREFKVLKSHEVSGGVAMAEVLGGKTEAERMEICAGGGGSNVAVGLKKLGEAVKLISRVGEDFMGKMLLRELEGYSLSVDMIQRGMSETGVSTVLVNSTGGRSIITYRGESLKIDSAEIDWYSIKNGDWLQISSLGGRMDLLSDLVNFAYNSGIKIGINPGKAELESRDFYSLLSKVDFLSLNRQEASMLSGVDFEKEEEILRKLSGCGARILAVTDGVRGASLVVAKRWVKMNTFPSRSVDDTGAGDAFVSGALCGILNYKSDVDILKMGLANGSSVVTEMGAKKGLLSSQDMFKRINKKLKMVESWL